MKIEEAILQRKFSNSHQKALINLMYTSNWLRDQQNLVFKKYDILQQHFNALRIIKGKHPNPITPGAIKDVMLDKANDVTRLLDKLVNKGLICRRLCESNRRKMDITITEEGIKLLSKFEAPFNEFYMAIKERMSDDEAETLSNLLDKLRG